ncbi:MAG: hypothetical protein OEZ36_00105 [Spirochaetota bacterium]|nr:hypothetical protein [Spirochaetota bacterium]
MKIAIYLFITLALSFSIIACGKPKKPITQTETMKKIMNINWKFDVNAKLADSSKAAKETTGIKMNLKFKGDVGSFINAATAETIYLGYGKGKTSLVYKKISGKGLLKSTKTGYWSLNEATKTLTLEKADAKRKDIVFTINEITDNKLIMMKKGNNLPSTYIK